MKLRKISDSVYLLYGPTVVGIVETDEGKIILIDSGINKRHAELIYQVIHDYKFQLEAILVTHAHADHIGGCAYLQSITNCKILSSPLEAPAVKFPLIQSIALFGASPLPELITSSLVAEPADADALNEQIIHFNKTEIKIVDLIGHTPNHIGFLVNSVLFIGDALFPTKILEKNKFVYHFDPLLALETINSLPKLIAQYNVSKVVGSHVGVCEKLEDLVFYNKLQIEKNFKMLLQILATPITLEKIVKEIISKINPLKNFDLSLYFLFRASILAYLSALRKQNKIGYRVLDNSLIWYLK